jgi:hypothetical protein
MDSMLSLSEAQGYLSDKMKRPLWHTEKDVVDPLFTALCNSENSFNISLRYHLKRWAKENSQVITNDDEGNLLFPKTFLNAFAARRNRPNIPSGYALAKHVADNLTQRIDLQFKTVGVEVLDDGGRERRAYPEALLRFLAYPRPFSIALGNILNIKKEGHKSSEPETNSFYQYVIQVSIAAYHEYLIDLCNVPLALKNSFLGKNPKVLSQVTNSCMEMHSLELQVKNWGKFLAAQNDTTQAGQ